MTEKIKEEQVTEVEITSNDQEEVMVDSEDTTIDDNSVIMDEKEKKKELFQKIGLYLTGFFSGMSVMAIELGASRLMAPYFSSSQIVWTIIIGTIMIAMAIGNIVGGKMADKSEKPTKLFILLFVAATWTVLIPLFGKFIIAGISLALAASSLSHNFLIWAALLSCLIVFVFPLLVLGMVTPNLVRFGSKSIKENGKVVGRIEALNTIGSIIGTFLPTFVTIPTIGTSWTFIVFGLILFVICLIYFFKIAYRRVFHSVFSGIIVIIGILSSNIGVAFWQSNTLYEGESIYNYLRVEEQENYLALSTNVLFGVQSVKMKEPGLTGYYYDYALAANSMVKEDPEILILGLCTGTYAYQTEYYYNYHKIDGVEIDGKIIDLAYEYFDMPEDVNVYINDGRAYMNSLKKTYDVIMVDAYQDITIPFSMSTKEFFTLVKNHLNEGGVMVVNLNMSSSREGSINDYLYGTITSVFNNCYMISTGGGNIELFASSTIDCKEELYRRVYDIDDEKLRSRLIYTYNNLEKVENNGYILTDDKAPVELLGMKVLDDMITDQLEYYRNQLKGKSIIQIIKELLNGELF